MLGLCAVSREEGPSQTEICSPRKHHLDTAIPHSLLPHPLSPRPSDLYRVIRAQKGRA